MSTEVAVEKIIEALWILRAHAPDNAIDKLGDLLTQASAEVADDEESDVATDMKRLLAEATPLPWRIGDDFDQIYGSDDERVTDSCCTGGRDAALIVAAVNALPDYEAAVDALDAYVLAQGRMRDRWAEGDESVKRGLWQALNACEEPARAALARLRGAA